MVIRDDVLPVGPPVQLEWQIGRIADIETVRRAAANGEDVVLVDDRRTGKTTVVLGTLELLANAGQLVFLVDATLNGATAGGLADRLLAQLAHQDRAATIGADGGLARRLWTAGTGLTAAIDDPQTRTALAALTTAIGSIESIDGVHRLDRVLDAIDAAATRRHRRAVICIDEVQAITGWPDAEAVQRLMAHRLGRRGGAVSFLFAGSKPSAMRELFAPHGMLRFHGIEHRLSPISDSDWRQGLTRAFQTLGTPLAADAVEIVLEESAGQPQRTMLVAREAHRLAESVGAPVVTRGHVVVATAAARGQHLWTLGDA